MGSVSIRKHIRWPPAAADEPTDTLVLTAARTKVFVDIRHLKAAQHGRTHHDSLDQLDWAFAGISQSGWQTGPDGGRAIHARWLHWVDSRRSETGEYCADWADDERDHAAMWARATDQATMEHTADGALEKGSMINPATGRLGDYEELWGEEAPAGDPRLGGDAACVVVTMEQAGEGRMGAVVRVG